MDLLFSLALLLSTCRLLKTLQQRTRIAFLATFLSRYRIEKNLETVTQGHLRALDETDPARQARGFDLLAPSERELCAQVTRLAADFATADATRTRVSKLPLWLPFSATLFPSFDMRALPALHARGICKAMKADGRPARAGPSRYRRSYSCCSTAATDSAAPGWSLPGTCSRPTLPTSSWWRRCRCKRARSTWPWWG